MYNDACFYCLRKRRKIYVIIEKKCTWPLNCVMECVGLNILVLVTSKFKIKVIKFYKFESR